MEIKIKNRFTDKVIVCGKYENIKNCLEKNKQNLQGADLRDADLQGAYLQGAYLRDAYLRGADLRGADLRDAYLRDADLRDADLRDAYLRDADLRDADLQGAYLQGAYLRDAYLRDADLRDADLQGAYLQGADLRGADLRDAYLQGAYLQGAYLQGAYLRDAYLQGAEYKEPLFLCDLYSLKLLPKNTILTFWKYLKNGLSPYQNMKYEVGKEYKYSDCNFNENNQCGEGGNVATLMWCLKNDSNANEFIEVEFKVKDIVAIPYVTDGKFRVKKLKVLRKIDRKEAVKLLKKLMK